jgi:phenylpropionate dioxygenase-like ring-hydroxylating dioxygenase large terminal subunit
MAAERERGATLPYRWYSDPEILRREQERVFARTWQYAGRADEVAEPGSYLATRAGDVPLLVTRDRDGELRAFLNVCRHRGSVLVDGAGARETVQCRYHAWTYGLDGELRKAPRSEREAGFDPGALGLIPASADTWGPFLFANPDPHAAPLAETLGELPRILGGALDLSRLRFHSRTHYTLDANWKIAVENFLECYHCPTAHPSFSDIVDVGVDAYVLEPHPTFATQYASLRERPRALPYEPAGDVERGQYHLLWPNLKLNVYPGQPNLSIGPVFPDGADRTVGYLDYFFGEDVEEGWIADLLALDEQVGREDTALIESVHRGMRSGLVEHGRLLLESEQLIEAFQGWLLRQLELELD